MSGHERHLRFGIVAQAMIVASGLAVVLAGADRLAVVAAGTAIPFTLAGSVAPDVDHHSSKGYAVVMRYGPAGTATVFGAVLFRHRYFLVTLCRELPVTAAPAFVAGIGFVLMIGLFWRGTATLIRVLRPSHRGITHRVSTWIVVVLASGGLLVSGYDSLGVVSPLSIAIVHSGAFLVGVTSHLYCDGLLGLPSVDDE